MSIVTQDWVRNFRQLLAGTAVAQILAVLANLWMARYCYTPDQFGIYGAFFSIAWILGSFSTWSYDILLVLPESEPEARSLARLSVISALKAAVIILAIAVLFSLLQSSIPQIPQLPWLLLPFVMLGFAFSQTWQQWLNRLGETKAISQFRMQQTVLIILLQIVIWPINPNIGLPLGLLLGTLLPAIWSGWQSDLFTAEVLNYQEIRFKYQTHIRHMVPGQVLNLLNINLQAPIIEAWFGSAAAGLYFMASRILQMPIQMLTGVLRMLWVRDAAATFRQDPRGLHLSYRTTVLKLSLFIALPLIIVAWPLSWYLPSLLGAKWLGMSVFIPWICLGLAAQALFSPVSGVVEIIGKTKISLYINFIWLLGMIIAWWMGRYYQDIELGLILATSVTATSYLVYLVYFWIQTKRFAQT